MLFLCGLLSANCIRAATNTDRYVGLSFLGLPSVKCDGLRIVMFHANFMVNCSDGRSRKEEKGAR